MAYYMSEIMKNHEGYYDPTAGKAIRGKADNGFCPGEIWQRTSDKGEEVTVLLISINGKYATVLRLLNREADCNNMSVMAKTEMFTDCGMLQYCYLDVLETYVRTLSDEELTDVKYHIADAIDIDCSKPVEIVKEVPVKEYVEVDKGAEWKVKAEVYEKLYNDLLTKVIGKGMAI